jgi:hypothetical protein
MYLLTNTHQSLPIFRAVDVSAYPVRVYLEFRCGYEKKLLAVFENIKETVTPVFG